MADCVENKTEKKYSPFDKKENREYSREEEIERFRRNIAYKKTYQQRAQKQGKIAINNGEVVKWILADMPIPEGWKRGAKI